MDKKPIDKYKTIDKNLKNIQKNISLLWESFNKQSSNFYKDQEIRFSPQTFVGDKCLMDLLSTENKGNLTSEEKFNNFLSNISKEIETYKNNFSTLKKVESEVEDTILKKLFLTVPDNKDTKKIGKHKKLENSVKEISKDLESLLGLFSKLSGSIEEARKIKYPVQTFIGDSVFSELLNLIFLSYGEKDGEQYLLNHVSKIWGDGSKDITTKKCLKTIFKKADLNNSMNRVEGNLKEDVFKRKLDNIQKVIYRAIEKYKSLPPILNSCIDSVHKIDTLNSEYQGCIESTDKTMNPSISSKNTKRENYRKQFIKNKGKNK